MEDRTSMIGETIGDYRLTAEIGSGWAGTVFTAEHVRTEQPLAVKVLRAELSQNRELLEECFADVKAASLFVESGVAEVLECDVDRAGNAFIAMNPVHAPSLGQVVRSFRDLRSIAQLGKRIASVLEEAHEVGVVHGDLKPENIFVTKDVDAAGAELAIELTDFGIAKLRDGTKDLAPSPYVSPEQRRDAVDRGPATDIYSLGCILFELACGKAPAEIPPPNSSFDTTWPPDFVELITRMLDENPERRPKSMAEVRELLEEATRERPRAGGTVVLDNLPGSVPGGERAEVAATQAYQAPQAQAPKVLPEAQVVLDRGRPPVKRGGFTAWLARRRDVTIGRKRPAPPPHKPSGEPRPEKRFRRPMVWIVTAAVLLLAVVVTLLLWPDAKGPETTATSGVPKTRTQIPPTEMATLAGGMFTMGSTDLEIGEVLDWCRQKGIQCAKAVLEREKPVHDLAVAGFLLDKTEVTNEQYAQWLTARKTIRVDGGRMVRDGDGKLLVDLHPTYGGIEAQGASTLVARPARAKKPVVQVTWFGADRYCRDQGKRLPTEAEWEFAARGILRRPFPWGDRGPDCKGVVFGREANAGCPPGNGPDDVGTAAEDVTPEGVHDLGGNVAEWTADGYGPYQSSVQDPAIRVIRGGDWAQTADACRGAGRARSDQARVQINVGFRCARDGP
jgi:formylglycine-generating enzyme required for sulfatase activity/tRNA A-37 threonylcarbamoyl transferase component Bud32